MDVHQLRVDLVHGRSAEDEGPVQEPDRVEQLEGVLALLRAVVVLVEQKAGLVYQGHRAHLLVVRALELRRQIRSVVDVVGLEREEPVQKETELYAACRLPGVRVPDDEDDVLMPEGDAPLELLRQALQSVEVDRKAVVGLDLRSLELRPEPRVVDRIGSHQSSSMR